MSSDPVKGFQGFCNLLIFVGFMFVYPFLMLYKKIRGG